MVSGYANDAGVQNQEAGFGYWGATFWTESNGGAITASATQSQAGATLLPQMVNYVGTVAATGNALKLPPSLPGLQLVVINGGANNAQVYASGSDTINGIAGSTGVPQLAGSVGWYVCGVAGQWVCGTVATGISGAFQTYSVQSVVATAGGTQGTSVLLTAMNVLMTGPASGASGLLLPPAVQGMEIALSNGSANATPPTIFASGTNTINGTAGATGITGPANTPGSSVMILYSFSSGTWSTK